MNRFQTDGRAQSNNAAGRRFGLFADRGQNHANLILAIYECKSGTRMVDDRLVGHVFVVDALADEQAAQAACMFASQPEEIIHGQGGWFGNTHTERVAPINGIWPSGQAICRALQEFVAGYKTLHQTPHSTQGNVLELVERKGWIPFDQLQQAPGAVMASPKLNFKFNFVQRNIDGNDEW